MAGISLAEKLVKQGRNKGKIIARGKTVYNESYILVQLEEDKGRIFQFDYGADIRFEENIDLNDIVELRKIDEYSAKWFIVKKGERGMV